MEILERIILIYGQIILIYFFMVSIFYVILISISSKELRNFMKIISSEVAIISSYIKPISIIVPAFNEEETIVDNIISLLNLNYPEFEIILVNDGSTDETLKKIIEYFDLRQIDLDINKQVDCENINAVYGSFVISKLIVVDKENGGKSDALNAGINISRYPLFCGIDADCIIEKNALLRIVRPFLKYEDTLAVGGIVRIANGCIIEDGKIVKVNLPKSMIVRFQILEYFRAFLTSRVGWEKINALLIISGAFGVFKKSAVIEVGGYLRTIGEDMELTLRIHEHFREKNLKYRIDFASDAVCWTQAPSSLKGLKSQRIRWHRGLIDSILKHKKMIFNRKFGLVGMISMPYFLLVELLGPAIEMIGYIMLVISISTNIELKGFILLFLVAFLFGMLFSLSAILFEQFSYKRYTSIKEITILVVHSFCEQFFYRQLTVFWRVSAFFNYRKGSKQWGVIKRDSFKGRDKI